MPVKPGDFFIWTLSPGKPDLGTTGLATFSLTWADTQRPPPPDSSCDSSAFLQPGSTDKMAAHTSALRQTRGLGVGVGQGGAGPLLELFGGGSGWRRFGSPGTGLRQTLPAAASRRRNVAAMTPRRSVAPEAWGQPSRVTHSSSHCSHTHPHAALTLILTLPSHSSSHCSHVAL